MDRPAKLQRLESWYPPCLANDPLLLSDIWDDTDGIVGLDEQDLLKIFYAPHSLNPSTNQIQKRNHEAAFNEVPQPYTREHFPDYLPTISSPIQARDKDLCMDNPFADHNGASDHPTLRHVRPYNPAAQTTIHLDGFLKCHFHVLVPEKRRQISKGALRHLNRLIQPASDGFPQSSVSGQVVPYLPPYFGDVDQETSFDRMLFDFFKAAVCLGRTVIINDNTYLKEIAPMAERQPLVKHAILALASSYVLDYYRHNELVAPRANYHYRRAVQLLGEELKNADNMTTGKGDFVVAALNLLAHNEIINWEGDRNRGSCPAWYRACVISERILDFSNPSSTYLSPENVQLTRARIQLASRVCLYSVLSHCVHPIMPTTSKCNYPWLLLGNYRERRRIIGSTGLCPELMHNIVKITHLSAQRLEEPTTNVLPEVGHELEETLADFWQWSELSEGFSTSQELLDSCKLGEDGKVMTSHEVTGLIGESYVAAAQIYLQCRFFRRPRGDQVVQRFLYRLLRTIEYQPTSGPLFTAQASLFSIFIGGIVACKPEDRDVICAWFDPICAGARGNVLPAYMALKHIWGWLDTYETKGQEPEANALEVEEWPMACVGERVLIKYGDICVNGDDVKLDNSDAWWEDVVAELSSGYGRINLA